MRGAVIARLDVVGVELRMCGLVERHTRTTVPPAILGVRTYTSVLVDVVCVRVHCIQCYLPRVCSACFHLMETFMSNG